MLSVLAKYALMALWFLLGLAILRGTFIGRPLKGGMAQTRPPLRVCWPLSIIIWAMGALVLSNILMPF